jgi:hypothetical protein
MRLPSPTTPPPQKRKESQAHPGLLIQDFYSRPKPVYFKSISYVILVHTPVEEPLEDRINETLIATQRFPIALVT